MSSAFVLVIMGTGYSVETSVGGQGEKLDELLPQRHLLEDLLGLVGRVDARDLLAHLLGREAAGMNPAPDLRPRDLGRRDVLHQVVDRGRADTGEPSGDGEDANVDLRAQARFRGL